MMRRHLVYDENEAFVSRHGNSYTFRIRVWMAKDATPVVFVTPTVEGTTRPDRYAALVANWVNQASLRCDPLGMLYFDAGVIGGKVQVNQEFFEYVGHTMRQRLINPMTVKSNIERLIAVVGERVELC
jgi:hypothetical protein